MELFHAANATECGMAHCDADPEAEVEPAPGPLPGEFGYVFPHLPQHARGASSGHGTGTVKDAIRPTPAKRSTVASYGRSRSSFRSPSRQERMQLSGAHWSHR